MHDSELWLRISKDISFKYTVKTVKSFDPVKNSDELPRLHKKWRIGALKHGFLPFEQKIKKKNINRDERISGRGWSPLNNCLSKKNTHLFYQENETIDLLKLNEKGKQVQYFYIKWVSSLIRLRDIFCKVCIISMFGVLLFSFYSLSLKH